MCVHKESLAPTDGAKLHLFCSCVCPRSGIICYAGKCLSESAFSLNSLINVSAA